MFCENCGKFLQDGEVCTCTQQVPVGNPTAPSLDNQVPVQPAQPVYNQAPQYNQAPAGQPLYNQAPAGQPQYNQAPAGQPQYNQAQAGQPQYNQAPVQPQYNQGGYQKPTPIPREAFQPAISQKVGTPSYVGTASFLSSPLVLVFGIMTALGLFCTFILTGVSLLSIIYNVLPILTIIGIFVTFASAKGYMNTGKPVSTTGLSILSGSLIAKIVLVCVGFGLMDLLLLIASVSTGMIQGWIVFFVMAAITVLFIIFYVTERKCIKALKYRIADTEPELVSMFPAIMLFIVAALVLIGTITSVVAIGFMEDALDSIAYMMPNRDTRKFVQSLFESILNPTPILISGLVTVASSVIKGIVIIKAKQVTER